MPLSFQNIKVFNFPLCPHHSHNIASIDTEVMTCAYTTSQLKFYRETGFLFMLSAGNLFSSKNARQFFCASPVLHRINVNHSIIRYRITMSRGVHLFTRKPCIGFPPVKLSGIKVKILKILTAGKLELRVDEGQPTIIG